MKQSVAPLDGYYGRFLAGRVVNQGEFGFVGELSPTSNSRIVSMVENAKEWDRIVLVFCRERDIYYFLLLYKFRKRFKIMTQKRLSWTNQNEGRKTVHLSRSHLLRRRSFGKKRCVCPRSTALSPQRRCKQEEESSSVDRFSFNLHIPLCDSWTTPTTASSLLVNTFLDPSRSGQ